MTTISFVESATDYVECKWGLPGPYPIKIYFVKFYAMIVLSILIGWKLWASNQIAYKLA